MPLVSHRWKDGFHAPTAVLFCERCLSEAFEYARNRQGRDEREVRCPTCGFRYVEFTLADRQLEQLDLRYHPKIKRDGSRIVRRLDRSGFGAYTVRDSGTVEYGVLEEPPTPEFLAGFSALAGDPGIEEIEVRQWEPDLSEVRRIFEFRR